MEYLVTNGFLCLVNLKRYCLIMFGSEMMLLLTEFDHLNIIHSKSIRKLPWISVDNTSVFFVY